ncbi:DUF1659 domain-containing protein [Inediibacterium massiliense]|uniref:DUF1659 domain-containing protein n=1 Tax=Inediibacterium massiliense TaxID=1658111 RepID=UPI0006B539F3|nr:DUF1659 domain-containing protein [Inediibacterium massiliense]
MSVNVNQGPSKMAIIYSDGVDEKGNEKKKTKTYSNLKSSASNEAVYDVALAIIGLQTHDALEIHKKEDYEISQGA